ncbi:hypothetical protein Tsubulata_048191 [Turnera subulata]|uniref:Cytochrome P450 n=1 Tax=Turnera subulata TaxID=218843 RepID=A0A9Q0JFA8_9ROSI|nr:hypothetical protein Tsubulata_048191 [Turnera subulata]
MDLVSTLSHPCFYYSLYLLLFICSTKWFFLVTSRSKDSPPSPSKLPIIGNIHQLGLYPHRSLQSLANRHGPVMLLHFGSAPTLIISSADAAKEIMRTHDIVFSNRPDSSIARKLLYDHKDLAQAPYGEYWRQMRSICVLQLLSERRVRSFRSIREEETALVTEKINKSSSSSLPVNLTELFGSLTNDVICRVAFGGKYNDGDSGRKFLKLLNEFGELLGVVNIADFIPWLGWINHLTGVNSRVDRVFEEFDRFFDEVVDTASRKIGGREEDQVNFVDVLLEIQRNSNTADNASMERDSIKAMILVRNCSIYTPMFFKCMSLFV